MGLSEKFLLLFLHLQHFLLLDLLFLKHFGPSFQKPFGITYNLISSNLLSDTTVVSTILSLLELFLIHLLIKSVHLPHFFDFIKINDKASLISMIFLDTFSTKHSQMIRTVKMLNSLIMLITQQAIYHILVFEIDIS